MTAPVKLVKIEDRWYIDVNSVEQINRHENLLYITFRGKDEESWEMKSVEECQDAFDRIINASR